MSIQPMLFFPYNYCRNCKTNSIELFSYHNYPQKYQKILDFIKLNDRTPDNLDKYGVFTMRCTRCGKEYKILWENGIPKPIINNFDTELFMDRFINDGINGKPTVADNIYLERMKD